MENAFKCWPKGTQTTNVSGGGQVDTYPSDRPRTKGGTPTNAYVTLSAAKHERANRNGNPPLRKMRSFTGRLRGLPPDGGEVPKG